MVPIIMFACIIIHVQMYVYESHSECRMSYSNTSYCQKSIPHNPLIISKDMDRN